MSDQRRTLPLVGILAIQGDVSEHEHMLAAAGATTRQVRHPEDLAGLDALVLPGGESTTIGLLAQDYGLLEPIRDFIGQGRPVWGTCAGLILLADDVGRSQPKVGGLHVKVDRNAFGRQINSFEEDVAIAELAGGPFRGVFIRAPAVTAVEAGVTVLGRLPNGGPIVIVRQDHLLATAFHPELTNDLRLHEYFLSLVEAGRSRESSRAPD